MAKQKEITIKVDFIDDSRKAAVAQNYKGKESNSSSISVSRAGDDEIPILR